MLPAVPRTLNPFKSLPNPRAVWAWGMYDLANQSFQLLINTLLFSVFVKVVIHSDPARGGRAWGAMTATSLLLIVVLSPLVGALADLKAWKRELLLGTGALCAAITASLGLLQPGQGALAFALYVVAAVACGLGENFLGSFLPEISTPNNVGYISALGWTMSYIGALFLVGIVALYAYVFNRADPSQMRPIFVFAGAWFAAGMLPAALFLREKARPAPGSVPGALIGVARRLARSAAETRRFRDLARFFLAFFVYSMGTQSVIYFLGIIGEGMGFMLPQMLVFALVIALTAGAAAALTARVQDRVGHRRTVSAFLILWIIASLGLGAGQVGAPIWVFWVLSCLVGVALGGIGTSSRALVGAFTPESRSAEFFGLWGMMYKLAGAVGVVLYVQVSTRFANPAAGRAAGFILLAAFFATGLALLRRVNEQRGITAAHSRDAP